MRKPNNHPLDTNLARRMRNAVQALALAVALLTLTAVTAAARPAPANTPSFGDASPSPTIVRVTPSSGFDWGDAAIGAAAGLAISLVAIGGTLVLSRRDPGVGASGSAIR